MREKHLGGHAGITHIDIKALEFLKQKYNVKTLYDLGCGPGGMISTANDLGMNSIGIDGDTTLKFPKSMKIIFHDFTKGAIKELEHRDACWSCEFLEHVEEKYLDNIFSVFNAVDVIFCTASPNPHAYHHVNAKPVSYWIKEFSKRGFEFDKNATEELRTISSMKRDFVRTTGMVYINKNEK